MSELEETLREQPSSCIANIRETMLQKLILNGDKPIKITEDVAFAGDFYLRAFIHKVACSDFHNYEDYMNFLSRDMWFIGIEVFSKSTLRAEWVPPIDMEFESYSELVRYLNRVRCVEFTPEYIMRRFPKDVATLFDDLQRYYSPFTEHQVCEALLVFI